MRLSCPTRNTRPRVISAVSSRYFDTYVGPGELHLERPSIRPRSEPAALART
jgi:hypothetical protein